MGKADDLVRGVDLAKLARDYGIELEKEGKEWKACCPFHNEDTPSWKIFQGKDGKWRYECFGCSAKGDAADLIRHMENLPDTKAALTRLHEIVHGTAPASPRPAAPSASSGEGKSTVAGKGKSKRRTKPGRELAVYDYHDAEGQLVFQVVRKELIDAGNSEVVGKTFLQRHKGPDGAYVWNLDGVERVLYRLPRVLAADKVWLVEGEKDVHTLEGLGLVATTIPGGARANWAPGFTAALAGRRVILCGDGDKPGQEHMARCAIELRSAAAELGKCSMPEGIKDVTDYMAAGHTLADLQALVEPLHLPAPVLEFPTPSSAGAGPRDGGGPGGGGPGGGGDGGDGGDLPPDGSDGPDPRWETYLLRTIQQAPRPLLANVLIALRLAPEWHGVLAFNEFSSDVVARREFPGRRGAGDVVWSDRFDVLLTEWLHHKGIGVSVDVVGKAVQAVAEQRPFHPVREYLEGLQWDGVERIEHWLVDHAQVEDSEYVRAVSARWMISAVARIYQPGCKADCCLILESPHQGAGKSTTIKTLGDPWWTDDMSEMGSKDSAIQTRGVWIVELSELDSMKRADQGRVKAFISRATDRYRPPYGHRPIDQPRQCVFAGTVNHSTYLNDETGGRRFWPIAIPGYVDLSGLAAARNQLWAEAYQAYKAGRKWWLDEKHLQEAAEREQMARYEGDPWEPRIADFLLARNEVTIEQLLDLAIGKPMKDWNQQDKVRVGRCLRSLRWIRGRASQPDDDGRRTYVYRPSYLG